MATILEDIAQFVKIETPPETYTEVASLVKKAIKSPNFTKFSEPTKEYLNQATSNLKARLPIVLPPDFIEQDDLGDNAIPGDFTCDYTQKFRPVEDVLNMLQQGRLKLPVFQRKFVWSAKTQQAFARSIMTGLPTPSFFFAVDVSISEDRFILDGFQRTSTMLHFLQGKFTLGTFDKHTGLSAINGKRYQELPKRFKNKFLQTDLVVIEVKTARKWWPFLFTQINSAPTPLNEYELRRSAFENNPLLIEIDDFVENDEFWAPLYSKNTRYKGSHSVLKALIMHIDYMNYKRPMKQFLSDWCERYDPERMDPDQTRIKLHYIASALSQKIGRAAFRTSENAAHSQSLIECVFHAGMTLLELPGKYSVESTSLNSQPFTEKLTEVRAKFLADQHMLDTLASPTTQDMVGRMQKVEALIREVAQ